MAFLYTASHILGDAGSVWRMVPSALQGLSREPI